MSTTIQAFETRAPHAREAQTGAGAATRAMVLAGRILFALIFLQALPSHFSGQVIAYAAQAGVPLASVLVPFSGLLAGAGGLSVALGYHTRIGALLLVLFLVPVTVQMHAFWATPDPMMAQMQMAMFMKNVSLLGGALLLSQFGAGPLSLDERRLRTSLQ